MSGTTSDSGSSGDSSRDSSSKQERNPQVVVAWISTAGVVVAATVTAVGAFATGLIQVTPSTSASTSPTSPTSTSASMPASTPTTPRQGRTPPQEEGTTTVVSSGRSAAASARLSIDTPPKLVPRCFHVAVTADLPKNTTVWFASRSLEASTTIFRQMATAQDDSRKWQLDADVQDAQPGGGLHVFQAIALSNETARSSHDKLANAANFAPSPIVAITMPLVLRWDTAHSRPCSKA